MKKYLIIIFVIVFSIFVSGCDGNVTRTVRHAGFSLDGDFKCDVVMPSDKKDTSYAKIKYMFSNFMVSILIEPSIISGNGYELLLGVFLNIDKLPSASKMAYFTSSIL